ncbi:MAG: DUF5916 domain-containing protein, partial [Candidatus Eisenbacteria bacterium]|nr:DUF5916 domain-containing protein [Candidatus Eisenbacteria bacterium]
MTNLRVCLAVCLVSLSVLLVLHSDSLADGEEFVPNVKPSLTIPRVSTPIQIDGELDDPGWQSVARASNFTENFPDNKAKPPVDTEVLVAYDNTYLYMAFIAYDTNPNSIRCSLRNRDEIWQDDYIGVILDTFGDAVIGYELFVNPIGIQGDGVQTMTGEDMSFDIIFQSKGKITDKGYQVEVALPFSSLRFPNKTEQTWKATFWRTHPRQSRSTYSWAYIDNNVACWMCQFGTLTGIRNVKPGAGIELLPFATGFQFASLRDPSVPGSGLRNADPTGRAGVGVRYFVTTSMTAEATYKPDFSQVESDPAQIDVNTTFALFYSERRPFFQEGSDMFSLRNSAFYSRSINDPLAAAKLTGRIKKTDIAYLAAYDQHSPVIIPFEERSAVIPSIGKSTSNVLRIRQTLRENSYAGGILIDRRREGDGAGSIFGVDGSIAFLKNYHFDWEALFSHTEEPRDTMLTADISSIYFDKNRHTAAFDGERYRGNSCFAGMRRSSKHVGASIAYVELSPSFRADNGYITRNNLREVESGIQVRSYPKSRFLDNIGSGVEIGRVWNYDGIRKDEWLVHYFFATFKHQTSVFFDYVFTKEKFRGVQFPAFNRMELNLNSNFSEPLGIGCNLELGQSVARFVNPPVERQLFFPLATIRIPVFS